VADSAALCLGRGARADQRESRPLSRLTGCQKKVGVPPGWPVSSSEAVRGGSVRVRREESVTRTARSFSKVTLKSLDGVNGSENDAADGFSDIWLELDHFEHDSQATADGSWLFSRKARHYLCLLTSPHLSSPPARGSFAAGSLSGVRTQRTWALAPRLEPPAA